MSQGGSGMVLWVRAPQPELASVLPLPLTSDKALGAGSWASLSLVSLICETEPVMLGSGLQVRAHGVLGMEQALRKAEQREGRGVREPVELSRLNARAVPTLLRHPVPKTFHIHQLS